MAKVARKSEKLPPFGGIFFNHECIFYDGVTEQWAHSGKSSSELEVELYVDHGVIGLRQ